VGLLGELADEWPGIDLGRSSEELGRGSLEHALVVGGVEQHALGRERAVDVDQSVVHVAALAILKRVGQLVLVEVDQRGQAAQRPRQERA